MPSPADAAELGTDVQGLAFMPGERTRDRGDLGELSGMIALVTPDAGRISARVRGTALSPTNDAVQVNGDAPAHLIAVDGGLYHLRFESAGGPSLETLVSSPYYFQVDDSAINPTELFTPFSDAVAEQDRTSQWRRLLAEAVPLTAHLLRPLNVRVLWPIRIDPETHAEVPADAVPAWDPPAGEPVLPLRSTSSGDTPPAVPTSPTIRPVTLRPATAEHRATIVRHGGDPLWDPVPGEDGAIVPVRLGLISWDVRIDAVQEVLSSLTEAGEVELWRKFAARALAVLVARAVLTQLGLVELTAAIRGPGAPMGIPGPHLWTVPAVAGDRDRLTDLCDRSPADPLRDLLALHRPDGAGDLAADLSHADGPRFGSPRWTDLAALHASSHPALRPFQNDPRGLPAATMTQYDVLAGLVDPLSLAMSELIAPLPRPYAGLEFGYGDHDATVIDDDGTTLELPDVRYAGQTYAEADPEAEPGPEAEPDPEAATLPRPPGVGTDLIALMQRDLWQLGLTQGMGLTPSAADRAADTVDSLVGPVHAAGRYGYLNYTDDGPDWSGALGDGPAVLRRHWDRWRLLKRGHSGWAVRELQIAANVGRCAVVERLDATAPYADRLVVRDRRDDDEHVVPITGLLDPVTAALLRRWRFMRRRSPVVIEAWCSGAADPRAATGPDGGGRPPSLDNRGPGNRTYLWHDNVVNADDVMSTKPRMFVTDLSEQFTDQPTRRETLGDWSSGLRNEVRQYQQGPQARLSHTRGANSPFAAVTEDELHDFQDNDDAVYDLLWPSVTGECWGYYDVLNLYDRAVVSLPLFHHTLVLGSDAEDPAHVAGIVAFLADPADILDAARDGQNASHSLTPEEATAFRQAAQRVGRRAFARYGVSASALTTETYGEGYLLLAGLERVPDAGGGADLDMSSGPVNDRKGSLYQATAQWFRTWPWFWRLAGSMRADVQQRRLIYLYDVMWARRQFDHVWGATGADTEIRYQALGAMWFRHRVHLPSAAVAVRNAIRADQIVVDAHGTTKNPGTDTLTATQIDYICNHSLGGLERIVTYPPHADLLRAMADTTMPTMADFRAFKERLARQVSANHAGDEGP